MCKIIHHISAAVQARIVSAAGSRDFAGLRRLRAALTEHRPISHYSALPEDDARALVALADTALALGQSGPNPHKRLRVARPAPALAQDTVQNADLFADLGRWPRRPYCSDNPGDGLRIRPLHRALSYPHISVNPPHLRVWSLHDIDRSDAASAWQTAGLPQPTWTAISRDSGRAHCAWGLAVPVLMEGLGARDSPIRFLQAIESLMGHRLQSDQGYGGLITKNPGSTTWDVQRGPKTYYTLQQLAAALPGIEKYRPKKLDLRLGLGRNIALFETLRAWAYTAIRRYQGGGLAGWNAWMAASNSQALIINADLFGGQMLGGKEVWHVAKSVSKWVWRNFDSAASDARFSALQSARVTKRWGDQRAQRAKAILDDR